MYRKTILGIVVALGFLGTSVATAEPAGVQSNAEKCTARSNNQLYVWARNSYCDYTIRIRAEYTDGTAGACKSLNRGEEKSWGYGWKYRKFVDC
ncbi:hypothetical protein D5S17_08145 [Pseudonocardiaceae bacterium YIM PH 21723]|nr:hypothetical protein D5S17_08145 [Pseudonocardiaceae bacterium YIM PH 21723]